MNGHGAVIICGGNFDRLEPRSECPNTVHDWPLPVGYNDAAEVAASRLANGWINSRCPDCRLYGWRPGRFRGLAAESRRVVARVDGDKA
jgi:hypothetical protein